ncbi:hypothetical protein GLAREA_03887 [Glarea lozoyensis ATCC 20868]|uniref:Uncharacterized protein n=1 Tax=Glarea lozoyensis (strain ATCC 20868 / MF5171) TaxID=1116229 RepID=S3CZ91_GLAL2|nr:uncharacterized protein GLAREA_03887 [Glarea lozoyensis ATCC 20868]EPE30920.1 hypothetical protein GLAREA_03887 [Glarea lozoyensis ATCC 20868]
MATTNHSYHPQLLNLPRELRDTIWNLTLTPRILIILPQLPLYGRHDQIASYDTTGENLSDLETDSISRRSHSTTLTTYFRLAFKTLPDDWFTDRVPRGKNVFYKKYATNLACRCVNRQVFAETAGVLDRIARVLRDGIQLRQIIEPARPAFLDMLGQSVVILACGRADTLSFLLTTATATLASVKSVYFAKEMMYSWDVGLVRSLWGIQDRDTTEHLGVMTRLLKARLPNLREFAFWAPLQDYIMFWEDEYPFDLVEDICELFRQGTIDLLHIVVARDGNPDETQSNGATRHFTLEDAHENFMSEHGFEITEDIEELRLAERRWFTEDIARVGTLRRVKS